MQFIEIISHHKKIGYYINVFQQTACFVVNPIKVGNFVFLFKDLSIYEMLGLDDASGVKPPVFT